MSNRSHEHASADRLQALLDGALPPRERARVEEHLAACARCSEDLEGWRVLFEDLAALPRLAPPDGFQGRVMASVELPGRVPLSERLRRGLLAILPSPRPEHPADERLQDYLDGSLPARLVARIDSHVEGCTACSAEVDAWRAVYARLGGLEGFAPGEGFAARVMAGVRLAVPAPAAAAATPSGARAFGGFRLSDWRRALMAVGRFVPRTRRAWAALSGVALTPAVTVGLVLYTVFSHPTLTPQALVSFVVWNISDLLSAAGGVLATVALDAGQAIGVDAVVRTLFEAPFMLAGGALAYSLVSALALRVLYKNLLGGRRYARVSHS
jgi:anti-sigma factor RsiW